MRIVGNNPQLSRQTQGTASGAITGGKPVIVNTDGTVSTNDLIGFRPNSEYEFVFEGKRLYRVLSNFITIKYEYQGNEEEYNPSWS